MRVKDFKTLYNCNTCELWFYEEQSDIIQCPQCTKKIEPIQNYLDRHREQCENCENIFETIKKSPYENAHFLNCDSCMSILKISYSDSILQKAISEIDLSNINIGINEVEDYWLHVEDKLIKCLCGGQFKHSTSKKCPFCLNEINNIGKEYLIVNNPKAKVTIPVISKHIWKNLTPDSRKNLLNEDTSIPVLKAMISYMKTLKYFQELYFENKKCWAENIDTLKKHSRVEYLVYLYSFMDNEGLLQKYFKFAFEIFPDTYHLIALPISNEFSQAYLLQGKTGEIEIHPSF